MKFQRLSTNTAISVQKNILGGCRLIIVRKRWAKAFTIHDNFVLINGIKESIVKKFNIQNHSTVHSYFNTLR